MPITVWGPEAAVAMLNRAFYDQSPTNAAFKSQMASAGVTQAGKEAFALQFGAAFQNQTEAQLQSCC